MFMCCWPHLPHESKEAYAAGLQAGSSCLAASTAAASQTPQFLLLRAKRLSALAWVQEKHLLELERDLDGFADELIVETQVCLGASEPLQVWNEAYVSRPFYDLVSPQVIVLQQPLFQAETQVSS